MAVVFGLRRATICGEVRAVGCQTPAIHNVLRSITIPMPRTVVKRSIHRLKRWLRGEAASGPTPGADGFLYSWINHQLIGMAEVGLRKPYAWGMLQAASLASGLGYKRVSMVEFGVAGGNGLVAMETIAERIEKCIPGLRIDVLGFDSGVGLPPPRDYRDVPNLCSSGLYAMDQDKLRARLHRAKLILGNVRDTVGGFVASNPAPLAFIACDFVLYSSTLDGLRILDATEDLLLPRIHCYFDDVLGFTYSDDTGERLAIHEFNAAHGTRKISPIFGLKYYVPPDFSNEMWVDKFWIGHIYDHSRYADRDPLVQGHNLDLTAR